MQRLPSLLFVPGDRADRYAKAASTGADAIILDLEDAVLPDAKPAARDAVAGWIHQTRHSAIVRVNSAATPLFEYDLRALARAGCRAALEPTAGSPEVLRRARTLVGHDAALFPLIETAQGAECARELARQPGVARLVFGSVDYARDTGIQDEQGWLPARIGLVLASRLAGLAAPIDGTTLQW